MLSKVFFTLNLALGLADPGQPLKGWEVHRITGSSTLEYFSFDVQRWGYARFTCCSHFPSVQKQLRSPKSRAFSLENFELDRKMSSFEPFSSFFHKKEAFVLGLWRLETKGVCGPPSLLMFGIRASSPVRAAELSGKEQSKTPGACSVRSLLD